MKTVTRYILAALVLCTMAAALDATSVGGQTGDRDAVPAGVDMLLARGGIPAIFDPKFVSAEEADIPDTAWVLGVVIDGEAHAYSLNLLNHHEVVNDRFASLPVAAVW
jgi:hypothetical protein